MVGHAAPRAGSLVPGASRDRRAASFALVAAGSIASVASLLLEWVRAGGTSVAGYRIPSTISLLARAGLTGRWFLIPWAAVVLIAVVSWLALWIGRGAARIHVALGSLVASAAATFTFRSGPRFGTAVAIAGGILILTGGLAAGSKGRST